MAAFLMLRIRITDPERWAAYRNAVMPLIRQFGGRHLPKGAVELEGEGDMTAALFEFASVEQIEVFWNSPEYAAVRELRRGAASLEAWAIPATSDERTARE